MRKLIPAIILLACLLGVLHLQARPTAAAKPGSAYELIDAVNYLRASNGLPALQPNEALMNAAQGHSDYQASIQDGSHSGSGGSEPADRAYAAGYGGGNRIFLSENVYSGSGASPQTAVRWWANDGPHWNTMMGTSYTDIGAGSATDENGVVYFTLDVAYVDGSPAKYTPQVVAQNVSGTTSATAPAIAPVVTSTPGQDGSVYHQVQYGQTILNIASAYNVTPSVLLEMNGLNNQSTIFTGDMLVIIPPPTITPTPTITETLAPTKVPTRTPRPPSATPTITNTPTITLTPTPTPVFSLPQVRVDQRLVGISIIAICTLGLVLVGLTTFRSRKP